MDLYDQKETFDLKKAHVIKPISKTIFSDNVGRLSNYLFDILIFGKNGMIKISVATIRQKVADIVARGSHRCWKAQHRC